MVPQKGAEAEWPPKVPFSTLIRDPKKKNQNKSHRSMFCVGRALPDTTCSLSFACAPQRIDPIQNFLRNNKDLMGIVLAANDSQRCGWK